MTSWILIFDIEFILVCIKFFLSIVHNYCNSKCPASNATGLLEARHLNWVDWEPVGKEQSLLYNSGLGYRSLT